MSNEKEKFQMTKEEEKKLTDAMQKPEFRELLFDYVKEIQDPANKQQYEAELKKEKNGFNFSFYLAKTPTKRRLFENQRL